MRHVFRNIVGFCVVLSAGPASSQLIFPDGSSMDTTVYSRIVVVKADATDTANGTALLSALSDITDAAVDNRYLLQLEAGNYDLGVSYINMKAFVDLQGAGMNSTTITSSGWKTVRISSSVSPEFASTARAGIRNLEVSNTSSSDYCNCVLTQDVGADLYRVLLSTNGGILAAREGITVNYSDVSLNNCSIIDKGEAGPSSRGIAVYGDETTKLTTNLVYINSTGVGILIMTPSSTKIRFTEVHAGSYALVMAYAGDPGPSVDTFHSYFHGDSAFHVLGGSSSHSGTGFHGTRTGFTDGVDAFFSHCYDFTTGVTIPITDTSASVAP